MPKRKDDISGSSLGYVPSTAGIRGQVQGESADEYKRYVKLSQGTQARDLANSRGIDTSGMAWDGSKFADANASRHWYTDPRIIGPIAVGGATLGAGLLGAPAALAPTSAGSGASQVATAGGLLANTSAVPLSSVSLLPPSVAASSGASSSMGLLGGLGKVFGGKGIDPTGALLAGLSLFGGDDPTGQRQSFGGKGSAGLDTNPVQALQQALSSVFRLGEGVQNRRPVQLRSSVVQSGPAPVQLPGIPFQIGGGLGTDPALKDPSLLQSQGRNQDAFQFDPFQSIAQNQMNPGAKRRNPK